MRYLSSLTATFFIALFAMASVPTQAAVSPNGKSFYGSFGIGGVFTQDTQWDRIAGARATDEIDGVDSGGTAIRTTTTYTDKGDTDDISADVGLILTGALGYWLNDIQRVEIGMGYRLYSLDATTYLGADPVSAPTPAEGQPINYVSSTNYNVDINVIPITVNSYFYPFMALLPDNHHIYFGGGLGVGFWSFDNEYGEGDYKIAFMALADIGYEFYIKGLADFGVTIPSEFDNVVVGLGYQFSWSNPKFDFAGGDGDANFRTLVNDELRQKSHSFLFSARYEF